MTPLTPFQIWLASESMQAQTATAIIATSANPQLQYAFGEALFNEGQLMSVNPEMVIPSMSQVVQ